MRGVEPGPAEAAGIRVGDVLVAAGGRELRSVASLYGAVDGARATGRLPVTIVRGVDERTAQIAFVGDDDRGGGSAAHPARAQEHRV